MIHIDHLQVLISFCGLALLICGPTTVFGERFILRRVGLESRLAPILWAVLLAVVAFEFTLIGSELDPRATTLNWKSALLAASYAAMVTFLGAIVITYLYFLLLNVIKWVYRMILGVVQGKSIDR